MGPAVMILGIVLMIVIHEAGHFIAAKYFGMKATEAFFGFGPRLWSTRRGETEYGLKAIPLGGYVRIIGMNPFEEVAPEDEGRTYRERPFWQKSIVVLAGIASHFVVAFILFYVLAVGYGTAEPELTIQEVSATLVVPSEGADSVPFVTEPGDVVVSVDGVPIAEIDPMGRNQGAVVDVVVMRNGAEVTIPTTDTVVPTPASLSGFEAGDTLVAVEGATVTSWDDFVALTPDRPGEETVVTLIRNGTEMDIATVLAARPFAGEEVGFLGVAPELVTQRSNPIEGVIVAGGDIVEATKASAVGLAGLVTNFGSILGATVDGNEQVLNEVRPVSAIGLTRVADSVEIALALLAWVNVFVGLLNVVPLYPLDGGHFAVALYEKMRGRPADVRKMVPVAAAVFAFIVLLGILGIYFDIVSPLELPG
jgi:RIP metalloprotease RseP